MLFSEKEINALIAYNYVPAHIYLLIGKQAIKTLLEVLNHANFSEIDPKVLSLSIELLNQSGLISISSNTYSLSKRGTELYKPFQTDFWGETLASGHRHRKYND